MISVGSSKGHVFFKCYPLGAWVIYFFPPPPLIHLPRRRTSNHLCTSWQMHTKNALTKMLPQCCFKHRHFFNLKILSSPGGARSIKLRSKTTCDLYPIPEACMSQYPGGPTQTMITPKPYFTSRFNPVHVQDPGLTKTTQIYL